MKKLYKTLLGSLPVVCRHRDVSTEDTTSKRGHLLDVTTSTRKKPREGTGPFFFN